MSRTQIVHIAMCFFAALAILLAPTVQEAFAENTSTAVAQGAPSIGREPSKPEAPRPANPDLKVPSRTSVGIALLYGLSAAFFYLLLKFHRYWGLHVVMNRYGLLYMVCAAALTMSPRLMILVANIGGQLPNPWHRSLDVLGIIVVTVFPVLGRKPTSSSGEPGYVPLQMSRNFASQYLEQKILRKIKKELQGKFTGFAWHYDWDAIKAAGRDVLEEERGPSLDYNAELNYINSLPDGQDGGSYVDEKYRALQHLFYFCPFQQLRDGLEKHGGKVPS